MTENHPLKGTKKFVPTGSEPRGTDLVARVVTEGESAAPLIRSESDDMPVVDALAEAGRRIEIETELRLQAAARTAEARREAAAAREQTEQAWRRIEELETLLRQQQAKGGSQVSLRSVWARLPLPLRRLIRRGMTVCSWMVRGTLVANLRARYARSAALRAAASGASQLAEPPAMARAAVERLRVVFISGEWRTPGHIYRVERAAAAASLAGAETAWMNAEEIVPRLNEIESADVLWMWRVEWNDTIAQAVAAARRGSARIVYDIDDLMVDPNLARLDLIDGIRTQSLTEEEVTHCYGAIREAMTKADLCLATTEELAGHVRAARMPTYVLPNGFDHATWTNCRLAARKRAAEPGDGLIRIGYAGGSRTHQRDFSLCVDAVADIMRAHPEVRLVAFRSTDGTLSILDIEEFPALAGLERQIEWRNFVPLAQLPEEMARFDINLAPLEIGNPFCEAKSELKFFEAALVGVPTLASPTGPFGRAIRHGETGFLADGRAEWYAALDRLVKDGELRRSIARAARRDALWDWGPERRVEMVRTILQLLQGGAGAAASFEAEIRRKRSARSRSIRLPAYEVVFAADRCAASQVTIVLPLYNYADYVIEALESVRAQTLSALDLVLVDDASTDHGLAKAKAWAMRHEKRFNRIAVVRNIANSGLAVTRNLGFDLAETPYVLPLDADNLLEPGCAESCLRVIESTGAAFAYPIIQQFGKRAELMGVAAYDPLRLSNANYIDAMALVSRAAWAHAGGYEHINGGWEDFDLWARLAERGLRGTQVPGAPLAKYRVHRDSMIQSSIAEPARMREMMAALTRRHPWLTLIWELREPKDPPLTEPSPRSSLDNRLAFILPLLRCPESGQQLSLSVDGHSLVSEDRVHRWPLIAGRPLLFPGLGTPATFDDSHVSNALPASALALIKATQGPVLHLSAGGSSERFEHVIEVEAAVFRHTDVLADVHRLPFAEGAFDLVLSLNAFEHYREPKQAVSEILRVLKPGGRVLIRTAFLQPLHEAPWHFYNCTRYGLEAWFESFELEHLHVSDNFHAGHSLSWLASECEAALRGRISQRSADAFLETPLRRLVSLWRRPPHDRDKSDPLWGELAALPQEVQEAIGAGFEYIGVKPEQE